MNLDEKCQLERDLEPDNKVIIRAGTRPCTETIVFYEDKVGSVGIVGETLVSVYIYGRKGPALIYNLKDVERLDD